MAKKTGFLLVFLLFFSSLLYGQTYELRVTDRPLNKVLVDLRGRYGLHFSFDDLLLSNYQININATFNSPSQLLDALLNRFPLGWEKMGEVYVIFPEKRISQSREYLIKGQVLEKGSSEPLPFSHVLIDGHPLVTDLKGAFSYTVFDDSVFEVKASHLGCFVLDTLLTAGKFHKVYLTPSVYRLQEIVVKDNLIERSVQIGQTSGLIKLNSYIAGYLPGNGDNSVLNLLRLQPGITAAGEQPNDLIMWGSYEGTSRVTFDGITIWGLKNFNDNISAVNPFMVKNVDLFKGGYGASSEDLVGGIVRITGNTGNRENTKFNFFVNNQIVNGMLEVPLSPTSTLIMAARRTYNNLFDEEDVPVSKLNSLQSLKYRIDVNPGYWFGDFNAKYSLQDDNGNLFYVSVMGAFDNFQYKAGQERPRFIISQETADENQQGGASVYWGMNTGNGGRSHFKAAWSELNSDYRLNRSIESIQTNRNFNRIDIASTARIQEFAVDYHYELPGNRFHQPELGMEWVRNDLELTEDSSGVAYFFLSEAGDRWVAYVQDRIFLGSQLELTPGFRFNHSFFSGTTHVDPRLGVEWKFRKDFKLNAAWGSYHQFLIKSSLYDEAGNFRYTWTLADGDEVPVLSSQHWVGGASWSADDLTVNIEGFYKSVVGYTRYVRSFKSEEAVYAGKGRSYGIDVFVKKDFNGQSFWASYSLSRAEELFPYFPEQDYRRAPHDQRHELKLASLIHLLKNIHFSATGIFGSGFPLYANYLSNKYTEPDYSRIDLSMVYRFPFNDFKGEAGVSLLNVLNHQNVKYSSFEKIPLDQVSSVYIDAEAVEFTPLVFVKIKF
ncbi:TonB-dependent receptor [Thermophagus sp. OGC60D27]|uniref:TonB-dependent receptor n=1 Tax=Thermophagus sp. OGC60D27 TaxID=3458415 RepID=UPI0040383377